MPGSGVNLLWDETKPAETDIADAPVFRSLATSLRNGLAQEHNWPTATGANFGYHLLGSCRPYYDVESNVSSAGTDGRLMVTSDTSRFFHVGSAGTMFLGSQRGLSAGSAPIGGQMYYWATEFGSFTAADSGAGDQVTFFNSGFSGKPFTTVSAVTTLNNTVPITLNIRGLSNLVFTVDSIRPDTGVHIKGHDVHWMSIGTRVL